MSRKKTILFMMLAASLWSSSGLFIKLLDWNSFSILGGRSLFSAIVILIYLRRPAIDLSGIQIMGGLGYVGAQLFFVLSTQMTAAANAVFLHYTSPLYVFLFGYWFLGESPIKADWLCMSVIVLGMLLFLGDGLAFSGIGGNLFGALSGIAMATVVLCARKQKTGEPANLVLLGSLLGFVIGLPALLQETFTLPSIGIILFLGIFQMGIAYICFSIAIKHLQALEANIIMTLEPVLNPVWVFLVIGEIPGTLALFGAILVLGAVMGRAAFSSRQAHRIALDGSVKCSSGS